MPPQKHTLIARPEDAGKRLDQFLAERLPETLKKPVSKGQARKLIVAGAVYLQGKRVRIASKELRPGARVEAYIDLARLGEAPPRSAPIEIIPAQVLYEDEWLIAFDKPVGLPTQPTIDEARENLYAAAKRFLSKRDSVAQPYLGLHHRLDLETSGVVLFTKKVEANAGVGELFSKHLAQKAYQALTVRPRKLPPRQWQVDNFLGIGGKMGKKKKYASVRSGGDRAITDFRLLEDAGGGLLVEALPRTGRTHQIRVHLSEEGMPILGDTFYGAPAGSAPRVMLHAASLTFPHPVHKTEVRVQSPLPGDFLQCLQQIRKRALPPGGGS